jgi:D-serine deaminase-like pyridoxal phosphate-dependent protein
VIVTAAAGALTEADRAVRYMTDSSAQTARQLNAAGLFEAGRVPLVSAGGSSYFDRVVAQLGPDRFSFPVQTILRSGCYLTHDHGIYRRTSPFDGRGSPTGPRLRPAFELLASVLSRPEPTLAIVGFGRRDVPIDDRLPVVPGGTVTTVDEATRRVCEWRSSTISMRFSKYQRSCRSTWARCGRLESVIAAARSTGGPRYRWSTTDVRELAR